MDIKKRITMILAPISKQQLKHMVWISLFVFFITIIVIIAAYLVSVIKEVPPGFMTTDPLQTAEFPWYTGLLSNLGVILWSVSIGCAFSIAILLPNNRQVAHFLIATGTLSIVLVIDDMFRLHDSFFLSRLNIPEYFTFFIYGLILSIYLVSFYRVILSDISFILLTGALLFFGASIILDMFTPYSSIETFIKGSLKFIGIALWLTYNFVFVVRMSKQMKSG
jgi:hypothetical protein